MFAAVGIIIVLVMVFGGYTIAGGHLMIIFEALPFELIIIGGAGVGTFLMANDTSVLKHSLSDLVLTFKGPRWRKQDYTDLLCLLFELVRLARTDQIALEAHIESPETSDIFARYPGIRQDGFAVTFICDYLRTCAMSFDDPHQVSEIMERDLELRESEAMRPAIAIQTVADALPALGIVAAVLGVIKTMAAIDQPPSVLGRMIGGALVGTFLGVFLSYCLAGPLAARMRTIHEDDHRFYALIRDVLVAHLQRHAPNICVEIGRKNVPGAVRPGFIEVEQALNALKVQVARQAA
ncbi:MAG: flagellar motor stator protein MotA [Geminicoccaceae bacterium]